MKEILEDTDLIVGKTVSKVSQDWSSHCTHFTDGTCVVFSCEQGYDGGVEVTTCASNLSTSNRLSLNIISEEEANREEEVAREERELTELREYQRLKHIYDKAE